MKNVKYTKERLEEAAKNSKSVMEVVRYVGLKAAGGNHSHISRRLKELDIDTQHFLGKSSSRGKRSPNRISAEEILVVNPIGSTREKAYKLRRALIDSQIPYLCSECGLSPIWNKKPMTLEVDHIDRNWLDNRITNLRFLCPNCHSQQ